MTMVAALPGLAMAHGVWHRLTAYALFVLVGMLVAFRADEPRESAIQRMLDGHGLNG